MRLITHNMLKCNVKNVENGYPLIIEASSVETIEQEFDKTLTARMISKINIVALQSALQNIKSEMIITDSEEEENLRSLHHALFEIHVQDGFLICPESGRRFQVKDGIPNMLLHEDEV